MHTLHDTVYIGIISLVALSHTLLHTHYVHHEQGALLTYGSVGGVWSRLPYTHLNSCVTDYVNTSHKGTVVLTWWPACSNAGHSSRAIRELNEIVRAM